MQTDKLSTRISAALPTLVEHFQKFERLPLNVTASMDPRLQLAIINRLSGKPGLSLTSTAGNEVAVIARVNSIDDWIDLEDVIPGAMLGSASPISDNDAESWIVTGRLPIERIEHIRTQPCVISLKASQPVQPTLAATLPAMQVTAADLAAAGVDPAGGAGVVVGIVDFGCDFIHSNFRRADNSTRLLAIWNQGAVAQVGSPFGYGQLYDAASIDAALAKPNPYDALGYGPRPDTPSQIGTHGTHVMDIAAGNGFGSSQPGMAPAADLVFVEASTTDIAWQGPAVVNQSFGDSVQLLEAVRFIFDTAGDRPCVVNLSLGTNGGPHDGSSLVEQGLDALVAEKPNRAVVIAASNSQQDGIHTEGRVDGAGELDLVMQQVGTGGGELEIWYDGTRRLSVTLIAPDGTAFGPVDPDANLPIGAGGQVSIFVGNRLNDPNNHDNMIAIWVAKGLSSGNWTIRLRSLDGQPTDFHAWIERDDVTQASFSAPVPTHTLGSISTGRSSIVVGSYDAHKPSLPLSSFSSSGPTRDGREKPEVSAPGHAVIAARSRTGSGVTRKSGTSMAAPAVSGLIALMLAEAKRKGQSLTIDQVRQQLTTQALKNPPATAAGQWDPRHGFGRASGKSIQ
ncbi:S8 family serine peptidase [Rhizobium leguminosarum]|uniref:S8 family serine peptidase n=1 Tax=Rhizobium leguminosarum TaxID=384 RepID=UPI0021BC2CB1|nr:S8 family serine peptidase [Rhizobium leguminosarum]